MATLPLTSSFSAVGSVDLAATGGKTRTLFAWGDFAGGTLVVQAVVPHPDGDEVFDLTDEASYLEQLGDDTDGSDEVGADQADPKPRLELTDRGYLNINLRAPVLRISLLDCDDTPDVKFWIG